MKPHVVVLATREANDAGATIVDVLGETLGARDIIVVEELDMLVENRRVLVDAVETTRYLPSDCSTGVPYVRQARAAVATPAVEDFSVAIVARGLGELEHVQVQTSAVAVHEATAATLTVTDLDISGASGACATGIELVGDAALNASGLTTRGMGASLHVSDRGTAMVTQANISQDSNCVTNTFIIRSNTTFTMTDSVLDGGYAGVVLEGTNAPLRAALMNVVIRNTRSGALGGFNATVDVRGGELSHNGINGLVPGSGHWSLTNVAIKDNASSGIYLLGVRGQAPITLTMRSCILGGNQDGIALYDFADVDLGTDTSPGNNTFELTRGVGLYVAGEDGQRQVNAVGNTWRPRVQGADGAGKYAPTTITGPVAHLRENNFAIVSPLWSLKL